MKSKLNKLLKTIMMSSAMSLLHLPASASDKPVASLPDLGFGGLDDGNKGEEAVSSFKQKVYKNVLKLKRNGEPQLIAGHRSHSSHRSSGGGHYSHSSSSHRSHSSHRSSGGGSHYSHSSSSSYRSSGSGSSSSRSSVYTPPAKTYKDYSLGDRALSSGLYGSDVDELITHLTNKYYLRPTNLIKKNGYYVYDANVAAAVKRFQNDAGLKVSGSLSKSDATALAAWDKSKTKIMLGIRDISVNVAGDDVSELIILLTNAGYAPDPSKLAYSGGKAVFTEDVAMAVKMFQAYNGMQPTGNPDTETVTKLKAAKK